MALSSAHPDLVVDREPGGRVYRALVRDPRLRSIIDEHRRVDAFDLSGKLLGCFQRVFIKTVQGLFFGLYKRFVPTKQLSLLLVRDRASISPDQLVAQLRPNALRDITDEPLPSITPSSWVVREPIVILEMHPISPEIAGQSVTRRVFRLVRETPVEWIEYQPGIFKFGFVKGEEGGAVCIFDLWETLVVAVATPWPHDRGPLRRGRRNPLSRERVQTQN